MRYAVSDKIEIAEYLDYDVVIVGSGLAGLYSALNIEEKYSCCILTKERVDLSNSWLAQGGIAAAISSDDTPEEHQADTLIAGAGLCDQSAVSILVDEGPGDIQALVEMKVPFDQNKLGNLKITREGGHRKSRIVHAGGDATGRETVKALAYLVSQRDNVDLLGRAFLVDVLLDEQNVVVGALVHYDGAYRIIRSRHVIIATGGIGQVYQTSTNPAVATGDGLAAAMRAGAKVKNIEFIQFHPTGLWQQGQSGQAFLISEAVRGEGAVLRNCHGERFMENAHELKDLAPRDIVARAINREMERTGTDHVYLDTTHLAPEFLAQRFPTIYNHCKERGILLGHDLIPVCPVQHYMIGGIETDLNAKTSIRGLYACGEAASTGVHGANRLASNSMLECLVFGRRAAQSINRDLARQSGRTDRPFIPPLAPRPDYTIDEPALRSRVQQIMNEYGTVVRTRQGLTTALALVKEVEQVLQQGFDDRRIYIELVNIVTVAKAILEGALNRTESVGAHYRQD